MRTCKLFALTLMGSVMLSAHAAPVMAQPFNSVIDTSQKGSITLTKLIGVDGAYDNDPTGLMTAEYANRTPVDKVVFSYKKIADIVNVAGNVLPGDPNQASASGAIVGTFFTNLDQGIFGPDGVAKNVLGSNPLKGTTLTNGTVVYSAKDIEDVVIAINNKTGGTPGETNLNSYLKTTGTAMPATGNNDGSSQNPSRRPGQTAVSNLPLGLYLIGETDITAHDGIKSDGTPYVIKDGAHNPEEIVAPDGTYTRVIIDTLASPFIVSLPFTNVSPVTEGSQTHEAGTVWMYDLYAYPKDEINTVTKRIVAGGDANSPVRDGELVTRNDYSIGDTIRQVITADCPRLYQGVVNELHSTVDAKKHQRFIISDKMSNGLTFKPASVVVKVGDKAAAMQTNYSQFASFTTLVKDTDYKIYTKNQFAAWAANPNANAGAYATPWTDAEKTAVQDATFFIEMTSKGLDKLNALTKDSTVCVTFDCILNKNAAIGVTEGNTNHPALTWKNSPGIMRRVEGNHVYDFTYQINVTKKGVTDFSKVRFTVTGVDDSGNPTSLISFIKEAEGVYHVFDNDTDASSGKVTELSPSNQGASKGQLKVKGLDSVSYVVKEISTQDHRNLLKSVFGITLKSNGSADTGNADALDVFTENTGIAGDYRLMTGALGTAIAETDDTTANLDINSENAGIAEAEVENFPTFELSTGGSGRSFIYSLGGTLLMGVMAVAALFGIKGKKS